MSDDFPSESTRCEERIVPLPYSADRKRAANRIAITSIRNGHEMIVYGRIEGGQKMVRFGLQIVDWLSARGWS